MPPIAPFAFALLVAAVASGAAPALDREIVLTPHGGSAREDAEIVRWQERARAATARPEVLERLGWAYVAKARRTLDSGFYKLAEKTADVMDAEFGRSDAGALLRGHALHNLHRFDEAAAIAERLLAATPTPAGYALLSDVRVEQGRLPEAIAALQRLAELKPGAEADTRIAHVRWLKGDLAGAQTAMERAARAIGAGDAEAVAWTLARLSGFALQAGDPTRALALAEDGNRRVADFAPALLARGRALVARGELEAAVVDLGRAAALNPLPEYQWWLADVLRAAGRAAEAEPVEAALRARGAVSDPRTYAVYLATCGVEPATAVRLARAELAERQDVSSHDALAWALAAAGELEEAGRAMRAALAEGTRDARLFLHAAEIAGRAGRRDEAAAFLPAARAAAGTLTPSERARLDRISAEFSRTVTKTKP